MSQYAYGVIISTEPQIREQTRQERINAMSKDFKVDIKVVSIEQLKPRSDNPRSISQVEVEKLKRSMQEFPEMKHIREIVVDEDFNILAGTQRYYIQKDLNIADVLVKQVFGLTEKQKRQFIIKDNAHSGTWDTDIIANQWDPLELNDWGIDIGKFGDDDSDSDKKEKEPRQIECPECGHEFEI